ncbi:NACHT domain-containing protein [Streptomyces sp. NPDC001621]|uniref:NACHT domain-containing protein n=1 Tax=Streptomyces sp. NPDC001621 TaxID=3364594 RepID=UPI003689A4D1
MHLIRASYTAGLAHTDALRRLTAAGKIDPTSPWTLLRGALENFATALWLLDGPGRVERRRRALSLRDEDMRNRQQHETDTGHQLSGGGMTGAQRRAEIRGIADRLGPALTEPSAAAVFLAVGGASWMGTAAGAADLYAVLLPPGVVVLSRSRTEGEDRLLVARRLATMRLMKRSRTRQSAVIYAVLQVATVALALWLSKHFQLARLSATLVALAPTAPGAYLTWAAYRDDRREAAADTDAKARSLAAAVAAAETRQRAQLIGPGAHRIDVAFHQHLEPANNATGAAAHGRLTDIVAYYQSLHPARLAIIGEPGAGKTLLALDLILGLLTHTGRTDTDPVPVRFSLAGWNTEHPLPQWLAHQLHQQFRDQGITLADAAVLVDQHRILPVLDGLDEMDTDTTPAGRRRAARALEELNTYQHPTGSAPVILTCRTAQYEDLAALDLRMREAARIQLDPVPAGQAAAYLTARSTSPERWRPVIDTLTTAPGGTLARALATPWRLNLAATTYEERHPDTLAYLREPDHLLTLASPSAVRDHLLARYLPAATHQHPTRPHRYRPDQAHQWLAALAAHLATTTPATTASGTDIVLHHLWPMADRRRVRTADALLALLLALAFTPLFLTRVPIGFSPRQLFGASTPVLLGLGAIWRASGPDFWEPRTFQLQRLRSPAHRRQLIRGLMAGLVLGLLLGLLFGFVIVPMLMHIGGSLGMQLGTQVDGPLTEPLGALAVGITGGSVFGLVDGFVTPLADAPPTDPRHPVRDDLVFALVFALVLALAGELLASPALASVFGPLFGLMFGFAIGLAIGLYVLTGAGRRYLVFLCCVRGRLPWRLGAFLNWAYEAGLLRVSGVAYQFRHRELQDWLTTHLTP